jgi:hypothetical protein
MVFQDPLGSLHPRHTINNILKELLEIHNFSDIEDRIKQVLNKVGFGFKFSVQLSPSAIWWSTSTSGNWQNVNSWAWHITARRTNISAGCFSSDRDTQVTDGSAGICQSYLTYGFP